MKPLHAVFFLILVVIAGLSCSRSDTGESAAPPPPTEPEVAAPAEPGSAPPPLITSMPPQPPGPPAQTVPTLPQPAFQIPTTPENEVNQVSIRARSQFFAMDSRSPVINGCFERWEKPGPIYWEGNFTYKKPGDPPDMDIEMFQPTLDGEWAVRLMPKGTYLELYQDVKLPELDGAAILEVVAYVRNPIREGFAIRMTYVADGRPQVAEIYPAQTDGKWTRYYARIELPTTLAPGSVRLYLTRAPEITDRIIVDGVSVRVVGATGAAAAPEA